MTASLPTKDFYALPIDCFKVFFAALDEETDRARVILAAAWMDQFLEIKLMNEFSEGNSKARDRLFSDNGPFARLSSKLDAAFCAGWIDADVYHDASMIRRLRNDFAHRVDKLSLRDPEISALLQKLKVPHRQFHDWGKVRAAVRDGGFVLYTKSKPADAGEDVAVPGDITFRVAIPLVVSVLVANLKIFFSTEKEGEVALVRLPDHMQEMGG